MLRGRRIAGGAVVPGWVTVLLDDGEELPVEQQRIEDIVRDPLLNTDLMGDPQARAEAAESRGVDPAEPQRSAG